MANSVQVTVLFPETDTFLIYLVALAVELNYLTAMAAQDLVRHEGFIWASAVFGVLLHGIV